MSVRPGWTSSPSRQRTDWTIPAEAGPHRQFHLHRFEDDQRVAALHRVAFLDEHPPDRRRHRSAQRTRGPLRPRACRTRFGQLVHAAIDKDPSHIPDGDGPRGDACHRGDPQRPGPSASTLYSTSPTRAARRPPSSIRSTAYSRSLSAVVSVSVPARHVSSASPAPERRKRVGCRAARAVGSGSYRRRRRRRQRRQAPQAGIVTVCSELVEMLLDHPGVHRPGAESRELEQPDEERDIRARAEDWIAAERAQRALAWQCPVSRHGPMSFASSGS